MRDSKLTMTVDESVLADTPMFKTRYQSLISILDRSNAHFIKYETMVENFSEWLMQYLQAFKHIKIPPRYMLVPRSMKGLHKTLCRKLEKKTTAPEKEDIFRHKRQVTPGDFSRKLKPKTIDVLNREFAEIMERLDYEK